MKQVLLKSISPRAYLPAFLLLLSVLICEMAPAQAVRYNYYPQELMKSEKVQSVEIWRIQSAKAGSPDKSGAEAKEAPKASKSFRIARLPVEKHDFDANGNNIRSFVYNEEGVLRHEIRQEFDDEGKLRVRDYYFYKPDSTISMKRRTTIEYDKEGRKSSSFTGYLNLGDDSPAGVKDSMFYYYNPVGELVKRVFRFQKGLQRVERETIVKCGDLDSQCIEEAYYFGYIWDRWTRSRDENGNDATIEYEIPGEQGEHWTWKVNWDEDGRPTSWEMLTEFPLIEENKKTTVSKQENSYDRSGKLDESLTTMRDGSQWKVFCEYSYLK